MADKKISELGSANSIADSDLFTIVSSGDNYKVNANIVISYFQNQTGPGNLKTTGLTGNTVWTFSGSAFTQIPWSASAVANSIVRRDGSGRISAANGVSNNDVVVIGQFNNLLPGTANSTTNGFMSSSDKSKLDGIATGANVTNTATVADAGALMRNTKNQAASGGVIVTSHDNGVIETGSFTPNPGNGPQQHVTANGSFTFLPGTVIGTYVLDWLNGESPGTITFSGWTKIDGDLLTENAADAFRMFITIGQLGSTLNIVALQ